MSESSDAPKSPSHSPIIASPPFIPNEERKKTITNKQTYTDTEADTVLISVQGREFHVQSYFLKANR